ncbi:hypothetical protein Tco_1202275 [Tanacetum coccineum]
MKLSLKINMNNFLDLLTDSFIDLMWLITKLQIKNSGATREGSKVLCYSGSGGGVSVVVAAVAVVMIGCCTVEETSFGGDRSITGTDIRGTEDEGWWIGTVTSD